MSSSSTRFVVRALNRTFSVIPLPRCIHIAHQICLSGYIKVGCKPQLAGNTDGTGCGRITTFLARKSFFDPQGAQTRAQKVAFPLAPRNTSLFLCLLLFHDENYNICQSNL